MLAAITGTLLFAVAHKITFAGAVALSVLAGLITLALLYLLYRVLLYIVFGKKPRSSV